MSPRSITIPLAALLLAVTIGGAQAQSLPREFMGVWASDLEACRATGEHERLEISARTITGYEYGWDIRRWTRRGDVWSGHGAAVDDEGSTPATVRLRLTREGRLMFNGQDAPRIRCPERPAR